MSVHPTRGLMQLNRLEYVGPLYVFQRLADQVGYLDIGQGEKICLRLRPAHAPDTFRDETELLNTMLHEVESIPKPITLDLVLTSHCS